MTERRAAGKQAGTSAGTGAARKDVVKPEGQRPLVVSDPRLKAPERKVEITWRPGAATWNTDEQAGDGKKEPSRLQVSDPICGDPLSLWCLLLTDWPMAAEHSRKQRVALRG